MKWSVVGGAIVTIATINPVAADWQYTKWGMTPAEVTKASGGRATINSNEARHSTTDELAKLVAPYNVGEFSFSAKFMFSKSTDRLTGVRLDLTEPSRCQSLYSELLSKYDKPLKDSWSGALKASTWQDRSNNLRIQIVDIGGKSCQVIYAPLATANNKGL